MLTLLLACTHLYSIATPTEDSAPPAAAPDCQTADLSIPEVCNSIDDNCNGEIDEGVIPTWYPDVDQDGFGRNGHALARCEAPAGYVSNTADCDDLDPSRYPGVSEICDQVDNDCDGLVDDADPDRVGGPTRYLDEDGDGFGGEIAPVSCKEMKGVVDNAEDCDDDAAYRYPGAPERCNGEADDCANADWTEDEDIVTFYGDSGVVEDLSFAFHRNQAIGLLDPGTLLLCNGRFTANVSAYDNLVIEGIGDVTLSQIGTQNTIFWYHPGGSLEIRNLSLPNNDANSVAISVSGDPGSRAQLSLSDLTITGPGIGIYTVQTDVIADDIHLNLTPASRNDGVGIYVERGDLHLSNSSLEGATMAAMTWHGDMHISDSILANNHGEASGAAAYVWYGTLDLQRSVVTQNQSDIYAPISVLHGGLSCADSSITNNRSVDAAAEVVYMGAWVQSTNCDWGEGATDNETADLTVGSQRGYTSWKTTDLGNVFQCDVSGCR